MRRSSLVKGVRLVVASHLFALERSMIKQTTVFSFA
jgi:hypothetical protein